jgi:hypothetical protein
MNWIVLKASLTSLSEYKEGGVMSKEAYYFSHDANARQDEKILMLRAEYSWEGYGIYWALVEMMFESSDSALHHNKTKGIAVSYNIDITVLESVINTCITENLFVSDGVKFWSESLVKRKSKYHEIKKKKSDAGKKGMEKRWANKDSDNGVITDDNSVITKDNKGKESKENKSKENKSKETNNSPKQVYDETSIHYQLSIYFFERIRENNPEYKEPNFQLWADEIRKMIELDKRTEEQVRYLMKWVQEDDFEKVNVLSPSKIRKRFDNLIMKVKQQKNKPTKQSIFVQGEASKERQATIQSISAEEQEQMKKWEEELPY